MTNPESDRLKQINQGIKNKFDMRNPFRYFSPLPISAGKQVLKQKFASMPMIPEAAKKAVFGQVDKLKTIWQESRIPRARLDIEMSEDQYQTIVGDGDYSGLVSTLAKTAVNAATIQFFQSQQRSGDANDVPHWGLTDVGAGNGTPSRPLDAGNGTAAGAWGTATYGVLDLTAPRGKVRQFVEFNNGHKLGLFYPQEVAVRLEAPIPDISGNVKTFQQFVDDLYAWSEPIGNYLANERGADPVNMMTGNAETDTDFDLWVVNPDFFMDLFDRSPQIKLREDSNEDKFYLKMQIENMLLPIPIEQAGKWYKACGYVLACGS